MTHNWAPTNLVEIAIVQYSWFSYAQDQGQAYYISIEERQRNLACIDTAPYDTKKIKPEMRSGCSNHSVSLGTNNWRQI